jgi:hypothetical protein
MQQPIPRNFWTLKGAFLMNLASLFRYCQLEMAK